MLPAEGERRIIPKSHTTEYRHLRSRVGASDIKHLCVHTTGSIGLFGLGHSFHVPRSLNRDPSHFAKTPMVGSWPGQETTRI